MGKKIDKPWGWEEILITTPTYKVKLLHINAGCRTSLQRHNEKYETWISSDLSLCHIPAKEIHRLEAPVSQDLEVLEISHGNDSDIERLEDDYGRV